MPTNPDSIDWYEVSLSDEDRQRELHQSIGDLTIKTGGITDTERLGTLLHADPSKIMEWEFIGRGSSHDNDAEKIEALEAEVRALVAPLVGSQVTAVTNHVIRNVTRSSGNVFVEEEEEYSPTHVSGIVKDTESVVALCTANYPKGFGDHVAGRYPKKGEFERYRICIGIGELLIPIKYLDGRWNKLLIAER